MKKKICLIYTGGTIGMVKSDQGYVPGSDGFLKLLRSLPELSRPEFPDFETIVFSPLLDSSDIAVAEWNKLGRVIASRYEACDGFVVLHGTDTMAYSASALSFMLEGLDKPVIFTGSQIPLYELRSDGRDNLISAMLLAASDRIREVCIYFDGQLLRGNRCTKLSADRMHAFSSPTSRRWSRPASIFSSCRRCPCPGRRRSSAFSPLKPSRWASSRYFRASSLSYLSPS